MRELFLKYHIVRKKSVTNNVSDMYQPSHQINQMAMQI